MVFNLLHGAFLPRFRHHIGRNILAAAAVIIKGLDGHVPNPGAFPDDGLNLRKLNPEAPDFDLSVISADKIDLSVGQEANHITRAVNGFIFLPV